MPRRSLVLVVLPYRCTVLRSVAPLWIPGLFGAKSLDSLKNRLNMQFKAEPAEGSGYVPMEKLAKNPELPLVESLD